MFKLAFTKFLIIFILTFGGVSTSLIATEDTREQLVNSVKERYAEVIKTRQTLLNSYHCIALLDVAREYLERGIHTPADYDPSVDWSLVIRYVLLGHGYGGVSKTRSATPEESIIMRTGYALSHAYQVAQGNDSPLKAEDVFKSDGDKCFAGHVASFNKVAANLPEEVYAFARENHARSKLGELRNFNAWFAHKDFWATSGVLDPKISGVLKDAFALHNGTPIGFVKDLTNKLHLAISAIKGDPKAEVVVELVELSQQILMTLAAGVYQKGELVRLAPGNDKDWETIRKALFLALSVTSNPGGAENETYSDSFLSTVYNCGDYYPKKTEANSIKEYYWKLEAYANGFSRLWKGVVAKQKTSTIQEELQKVIQDSNSMLYAILSQMEFWNEPQNLKGKAPDKYTSEYGASHKLLRKAYEESVEIMSASVDAIKFDLAAALVLHPKLKHEQVFRTLYPDLTAWTTYHTPSPTIAKLVTGALVKLNLPNGYQPQAIKLGYDDKKWHLKACRLDNSGKVLEEVSLWQQGDKLKENFVGSLVDPRGTHLFSFDVDGATTTIKAISAGYLLHIGNVGTTTTVANGKELGFIESSAYPLIGGSTSSNPEYDAISIKGKAYVGVRGLLKTWRDNIWVQTETISTYDDADILPGHGFDSNKDLLLQADTINVPFSIVKAGQWLNMWTVYNSDNKHCYVKTYGSNVQAGNGLAINTVNWAGDSHIETEGGILSIPAIEFGRTFNYFGKSICFSTKKVRDDLTRGSDIYGHFITFFEKDVAYPPLTQEQLFMRWYRNYDNGGGGGSSSGGGFHMSTSNNYNAIKSGFGGSGGGYSGGGGGGGSSFEKYTGSYNSRNKQMNAVQYAGFDFAFSYRNGTSNIGGAIHFTSNYGSGFSLGGNYSHSNSDHSLKLYSSYNAPSLLEQVRQGVHGINHITMDPNLALHKFSSAAILQMTAPRDRMNMAIVRDLLNVSKLSQLGESSMTSGIIIFKDALVRDFKKAHFDESEQKIQEKNDGAKSTTGGPNGEDPDDEKNKKKGEVKFPDNPDKKPGDFKPAGKRTGAKENKDDGSVWDKDNSNHGGEQWKRWRRKKDWENGETPNSIWPDGTVRK